MQQIIEFRAFDRTFNVMLNNVVVWDSETECIAVLDQPAQWAYGDKLDDRLELNFEGSVPEWYCFTGGFDIEQFSGAYDTAGKKIFKGDIVKHGESIREVIVMDSRWILKRGDEGILLSFSRPTIIGNIHENPELLRS